MTTQTKKLIAIFVVMAITMFAIIKANAEVYPKSKFADLCEVITTPEYDKAVDEYAKLVDEYDSKADEYLANPTEEGYKELNKLQMNLFSTEEFKEYRKQGEIVEVGMLGCEFVDNDLAQRFLPLLAFCGFLLNLVFHFVVLSAHVNADQPIAFSSGNTIEGQGVGDSAVDQNHVVTSNGTEEGRQGDAGANGLEQTPLAKYDLASRGPVGGYGTIRNGQVFDWDVGDNLHDGLDDAFALNKVVDAEGEVDEVAHLVPVDGFHPFAILPQFACGINASDERSHRAPCNGGYAVALCLQFLYDSDVCQPASATARKD